MTLHEAEMLASCAGLDITCGSSSGGSGSQAVVREIARFAEAKPEK